MRRRLYLENPYTTFIIRMDDDNMCHIETREVSRLLTVGEVVERFNRLPVVQTYGIIESCIIDLDTGERVNIRTNWDTIFEGRRLAREESNNQLPIIINRLK